MPLQATSGAASYDAFGGGVPVEPNYIESVFSTFLYTGNGSTQTITTGVDTGTKGGLIWVKMRNASASHCLFDSARASGSILSSNTTDAATPGGSRLALTATGFDLQSGGGGFNQSGSTYASWTFREQPKFFDVVTYTGNGTTNNIAHSLASVPGMVIIKKTSTTSNWWTMNRDSSGNYLMGYLNTTGFLPQVWTAASTSTYLTSTTLNVNSIASVSGEDMNASGVTYVAYLFAHNAGGFGLSGTDNVISCGSYTGNGSTTGPTVTLGYEPQWVLLKNATTGTTEWVLLDNMRGMAVTGNSQYLRPNSSGAESGFENFLAPTATGFQVNSNDGWINTSGNTYIYIAIRRGPMKTPTTGTSVFAPVYVSAVAGTAQTTNFPVDLQILRYPQAGYSNFFVDRLRGNSSVVGTNQASPYILSDNTQAETSGPSLTSGWNNTSFSIPSAFSNLLSVFYNFRRAPGFFDVVCYKGAGSTQDLKHNLGVPPELLIFKDRSNSSNWDTYYPVPGQSYFYDMKLNTLATPTNRDYSNSVSRMRAAPDATTIYLNTSNFPNNASNLVCYLFATCPGVSKVGIVEATGSLQTVDCGFTSGARFVMIKSITDSSNSAYGWRVYDSARGITSGNDPVLYLNSTDAETNTQNSIGVVSSGFQITGSDPYLSSGSFIFLAIA